MKDFQALNLLDIDEDRLTFAPSGWSREGSKWGLLVEIEAGNNYSIVEINDNQVLEVAKYLLTYLREKYDRNAR